MFSTLFQETKYWLFLCFFPWKARSFCKKALFIPENVGFKSFCIPLYKLSWRPYQLWTFLWLISRRWSHKNTILRCSVNHISRNFQIQKVPTYGGSISAAMNIFSTSSESILSRCAKLVLTSSFFSSFEGFN